MWDFCNWEIVIHSSPRDSHSFAAENEEFGAGTKKKKKNQKPPPPKKQKPHYIAFWLSLSEVIAVSDVPLYFFVE